MWRLLFIGLVILSGTLSCLAARQRNIGSVKKEQQATQKKINETSKKLKANARETERNMNRLISLKGEIQETSRAIDDVQTDIASLDDEIRVAGDSIALLSARLDALKRAYVEALRRNQGEYRAMGVIGFVFSSESFSKAYARIRYIKEFSDWRKRKMSEIQSVALQLSGHKDRLGSLKGERRQKLDNLHASQVQLQQKHVQTDRLVAKLKKEGSTLQATIRKNEQRMRQLDKELDRLIVAEQRRQQRQREKDSRAKEKKGKAADVPAKNAGTSVSGVAAADRALSGSFENNKGRLLFPVRGKYTVVRGFGRQKHPELEHVETVNTGIDIAVADGAKARSIFEGRVSGVFRQEGYNYVVMVRHGAYISIYANLASISVKESDLVKANQDIGVIYRDASDDNRAVLHFELRKERTKLNPLQWVK